MQIWKIRIFWNELAEKNIFLLFQTDFIFDFSKNMTPRLYILFLIDKSKNVRELSYSLAKFSNIRVNLWRK